MASADTQQQPVVSRGTIECHGCGGYWEWPGTFAGQHEATKWAREHRQICGPTSVTVVWREKGPSRA